MQNLNHLPLSDVELIYNMFEECDLQLPDYRLWLGKRIACPGNALEYVCFRAIGEHYKAVFEHLKIIGEQIVCTLVPAKMETLLSITPLEDANYYAWEFLYQNFARSKAA